MCVFDALTNAAAARGDLARLGQGLFHVVHLDRELRGADDHPIERLGGGWYRRLRRLR